MEERVEGWSEARDAGMEYMRADGLEQFLWAVVDRAAEGLVEAGHGRWRDEM